MVGRLGQPWPPCLRRRRFGSDVHLRVAGGRVFAGRDRSRAKGAAESRCSPRAAAKCTTGAAAGRNVFGSEALVHSDIVVELNRRMNLTVLNIKFKTM